MKNPKNVGFCPVCGKKKERKPPVDTAICKANGVHPENVIVELQFVSHPNIVMTLKSLESLKGKMEVLEENAKLS